MRTLSRREFIAGVAAVGVTAGLGTLLVRGMAGSTSTGRNLASRLTLPHPFTLPLRVPPVLQPARSDDRGDHYEITQRVAGAEILPGVSTMLWGYNGIFPGPTVESRRNRTVTVAHTNELPVPTVVHLHGGRTPPAHDGYPIDFILPAGRPVSLQSHATDSGDLSDGTRVYEYPLDQPAATLWYHDHRMDFTGPDVWFGLAGFHIVRDDEEDSLGLPSGERELLLMLLDRACDADGSFLYPAVDPTYLEIPGVIEGFEAGVLGDVNLVNGVPWPVATVDRARYRLRILNAANARRYDLRLDPPHPDGFVQIGTDGGLLTEPITHEHIVMAPAQRFDVVVDFSAYAPGTEVTLVNDFGTGRSGLVMRFIVGADTTDDSRIPDILSTIEPIDVSGPDVIVRDMEFTTGDVHPHGQSEAQPGWLVNGRPFDPDTSHAAPALDSVEIWRLFADFHHPIHLHLNAFQVLSRGGEEPGPYDHGWKDTIDLRPYETAEIAVPFDGYRGRYVFHCHNLEHEDMAMMANFVVT